ncbi:MAG: Mov34/MPN/PAD-1 family protein [Sphingobium sp.]
MTVRISRELLAQIVARAAASPEVEVCGLLLGEADRIIEARAAANVADDPSRRFEIDPSVLFAAHRAARTGGPVILGHYHSHPGGDISPSACDAEMATDDGSLWLICSPAGAVGLWRAGNQGLHGRFSEQALESDGAITPAADLRLHQSRHGG